MVQRIEAATAAQGIRWSVPNQITLLRILLIPLFVAFLLYGMRIPALVVFCVLAVSDGLDGFIARRYHQSTELGAMLDPVADKLLLDASFWVLSEMGILPLWITILVVSRDVLIIGGAVYLKLYEGEPVLPPTWTGKASTCLQLAVVFWALLFYFREVTPPPWIELLSVVAGIATFLSGCQYLLTFMRRVGESP